MRLSVLTRRHEAFDPAHPPLPDRIASLQAYSDPVSLNGDTHPATTFLGDPEIFVRIPGDEGAPDGMVLDEEGFLWVALWGGNAILKYAPNGTVAAHIPVPAEQPTSVCLVPGGGRLFVTTAAVGLNNPPETSGAVLSVEVTSAGRPAQAFALRG